MRIGFVAYIFFAFSHVAFGHDSSQLRGRVWERGTITSLVGARITTSVEVSAESDENGRFTLDLPSGDVEIVILADGFEPLRVVEKLQGGQGLSVDYRLTPLANRKKYESTVRGEARHEGEHFTIKDEELHTLPGG